MRGYGTPFSSHPGVEFGKGGFMGTQKELNYIHLCNLIWTQNYYKSRFLKHEVNIKEARRVGGPAVEPFTS